MKYIYAALLLHSASKPVNETNLRKVLTAVEAEIDEARLKALTAALSEINIDEVLKQASTITYAPTPPTIQAAAPAAAKVEEKKEEKKEEEALAGLGALFG
ncbi:MAG: 50S ribosomal protein P1 [Candidatus Bathyarchaeia archaeon]